MKNMFISVLICAVITWIALIVWSNAPEWGSYFGISHVWFDMLSAVLFIAALVPSCKFEEYRQEWKEGRQ